MHPTITIAEANQRVDEYIARAVKVLPPEAKLELNYQERAGSCSDPTDHGPKNRVTANRDYKVLGLQQAAIPSYFDSLRAWWLANNFRVLDEKPRNEFLWVENNADAFQMTLTAHPGAGIFLIAGSPCVWPNGTPEPQAQGGGSTGDAVAEAKTTPPVMPPAAPTPKPAQARRPRRKPVDDDEDFDQTDWTDENTY
ncbi:hypothetical protein [Amycolatopsis sp. NPDC059657]|uniref:hypothetical protein n=1 Tax=Amycolatopsis sp. NPDC059657 TaxID=3346899 RepID=UPI003672111A